ncbi:MAG: hypothetical protein SFU56_10740 [Capsulimonadales bacterium]|nr:hypothetical protein [Capsulimonadales bacterium]
MPDLTDERSDRPRSVTELEFAFRRLLAEAPSSYFDGTASQALPPPSETDPPELRFAWRRLALFAETFREILLNGKVKRDVKATGGLRAIERATRQQGSIVFIDNPDTERPTTGSVFPYLPEITLGPRESFAYVHDTPVGQTDGDESQSRYLSAYAGLVKSDAQILTVHLRPDPYAGARLFVYGEIGQEREVVLFYGGGWGESVLVMFSDAPQVYPVGPSQVVALTTELAGRTFFSEDPNDPVLIGPEAVREHRESFALVELIPDRAHTLYFLRPDGTLIDVNVNAPPLPTRPDAEPEVADPAFDDTGWTEIEDLAATNASSGWYRAVVATDEPMDAVLRFAAVTDETVVWLNGERIGNGAETFDVRLIAGRNVLCVLTGGTGETGLRGPVTLTPSGGCFEVDIVRWRFRSRTATEGVPAGAGTVVVPVVP